MPDKYPDPKGQRRQSYDQICNHVLYFLDAKLKDHREALEESVRGQGLKPGFTLAFKPATPARPRRIK